MGKQVKTNKQILDELNKQLEAKKEHINKVKKRMELDGISKHHLAIRGRRLQRDSY